MSLTKALWLAYKQYKQTPRTKVSDRSPEAPIAEVKTIVTVELTMWRKPDRCEFSWKLQSPKRIPANMYRSLSKRMKDHCADYNATPPRQEEIIKQQFNVEL